MVARPLLVHRNKGKLRVMTSGLDHLHKQAKWCHILGSPITGDVIAALAEVLDERTKTGKRILNWPGDADEDALSMRIAGGLHALARRHADEALSRLYRGEGGDCPSIVGRIVRDHDDWLSNWLDRPPQTNEVGRAGALWPGLMEIAGRFGPDIELLELGASAGLNLNLDRFGYDLGGVMAGDPSSPVQIKPAWEGALPPSNRVNIVARAGVDRDPVNLSNAEEAERLTAFVWSGMVERMARIEGAIALAKRHPPCVERGDLVEWMAARLRAPQVEGVSRVFFHSVVFQYIPEAARTKVDDILADAGAKATRERPLARLQMEMIEFEKPMELRLQCWPGTGEYETLADAHPHGTKISWR
jgi:hypothetical protein